MMHPAWASLLAALAVALGDACNRFVVGWLPDDPPRPGRKQHLRPTPLAGMLLLPVAAVWLFAAEAWWPLVAISIAGAVGFVDDHRKHHGRDLDWRYKALGLTLAALVAGLGIVSPIAAPGEFAVIVLFVFVLTNATNFLDNTDGVATGLSAVSLLLLSQGIGWQGAVGFAALGFLPWNWPRPRVFLGDSGAYMLGIAVAIAAVTSAQHAPITLLAVAVQLLDFLQVVVARLWLGVAPWVGDRRHVTHIVQNLGVPRWLIAPLFVAVAYGLWLLG